MSEESYPYGGGSTGAEAVEVGIGNGACPPDEIWYRIYPEYEFNDVFSQPPGNIVF